jgi:hypothetical protein
MWFVVVYEGEKIFFVNLSFCFCCTNLANASGLIINTCGWTGMLFSLRLLQYFCDDETHFYVDGLGYELMLHCIGSFKADHVIVGTQLCIGLLSIDIVETNNYLFVVF